MAANEDRLLNDLLTRILTDVANVGSPSPQRARPSFTTDGVPFGNPSTVGAPAA